MSSIATPLNSTNVRKIGAIGALWRDRARLAVARTFSRDRAVDLAARIFATPPRHAHTARERELLAKGERFDVASAYGRLAAWRFGGRERDVVILVHGWGGRGAQLRSFVRPLVEAGFEVVMFDAPAHGLSAGRESTLVHFIAAIDAMVPTLESEGARIAGFVGHSLGAAAVGAWLNRTRRDLRAVLIAPPTSVERYSGYFARRLGIAEELRRAMQERVERRYGVAWSSFELPHSVAQVRAPALVIHDRGDPDVGFASGLALARAWRNARLAATDGLGHRAILHSAAVVQDTVDFMLGR